MEEICKSNGKEKGGAWECYDSAEFFGWEANRVVAAITGVAFTLEMATRAKTQLILILVEPEYSKEEYADYQKHFQAAADKGLVELVASANENESERLDELSISANENQSENENESESKCNPCCAIS